MPADIERTVIFDETVEGVADVMPKSRLIITAGDDGFISVTEITNAMRTDEGVIMGGTECIGLTPPQIAAIVKWANARVTS